MLEFVIILSLGGTVVFLLAVAVGLRSDLNDLRLVNLEIQDRYRRADKALTEIKNLLMKHSRGEDL